MREVFILENMAACKYFINDHIQKGYNEESFLGLGVFSTDTNEIKNSSGAKVRVTPQFLENDFINYIAQGKISLFENEPILIQPESCLHYNNISKWLILQQHSAIFKLKNKNISKFIKPEEVSTAEEFVNFYFNYLISKINEIRAEIAIILIDFDIFKKYLLFYLNSIHKDIPVNLETIIIKEIICFLSNAFFNNKIAIIPSSQMYFNLFLNSICEVKRELDIYSNDIIFRL